jgi:osmoprotectant transport system ATP-binding protein
MPSLTGVSKRFGGTLALAETNLTIAVGRTTVLIGPSGCGKSTLLRLMIGLVEPDTGVVRFEGVTLDARTAPELRKRMGYVIQDGGLFPHLTARDNVALVARHLGWSAGRVDARLAELATLAQLPDAALVRFPVELSGGQRQRVGLMRALMLDPDVLLLDEPLGALDPITRFELSADLKRIFERLAKTVVMVTHDIGEAAFFGHHIVLLREGRVVQEGPLAELCRHPADPFVRRFIGAQRDPMVAVEAVLS